MIQSGASMLSRLLAFGVALGLSLPEPGHARARAHRAEEDRPPLGSHRGAGRLTQRRPQPPLPGLPCLAADPTSACPVARALRSRGSLKVREHPSRSARSLGDVRPGAAVAILDAAPGGGACSRWLRTYPTGYLCLDEVRLGEGPAQAAPQPPTPQYAVVRSLGAPLLPRPDAPPGAPSVLHRGDGVTVVGGQDPQRGLLRVASRGLLRRGDVEVITPSRLRGRDLRDVPAARRYTLAFLVPPLGGESALLHPPAALLATSTQQPLGLAAATPLPRYTALWLTGDGARAASGRVAVRVADGQGDVAGREGEVDAGLLRRVLPPTPPPDLRDDERWIDVSLAQQVAVAYQGREAVFATLVSTAKHGTPSGTFFIQRKYRTQTMQSRAESNSRYDFREVPAAQFYDGRFGLHAALWHDRLGEPVSHGCVNLSPADAERLFAFTTPALPPGWHTIRGQPALPASRIVVRP